MAARPFRDASGHAAIVYWRRRAAALLVGLSVLALLSWGTDWGVGSLLRADRAPRRPDQSAAASLRGGAVGVSARLTGPTQLGIADATGASKAATAGRSAGNPKSCPAGDVVLTMFASASSYSVEQIPQFDVDVVSTADYACAFDVGAQHVVLQISAGAAQIWTSAECAESQAVQLATLHRGVPTVVPMTWDGQYSSAGCPVPGRAAPAGSYTATASAGSAASNSVTFRIG
jgi:hypothetical protein